MRPNHGLLLLFILWCSISAADDVPTWLVLSPAPNSVIGSGGLWIAVSHPPESGAEIGRSQFLLDGEGIGSGRRAGSQITFFFAGSLSRGRHKIDLEVFDKSGLLLKDLNWEFENPADISGSMPAGPGATGARRDLMTRPPVEFGSETSDRTAFFEGSLSCQMESSDLQNASGELLQRPPQRNYLDFNGTGRWRSFRIPVRVYQTSDEQGGYQPRNRFSIGLVSEKFSASFGDIFPQVHRLLLDGGRVRGWQGAGTYKKISFTLNHGEWQRGIEGSVHRYAFEMGFPPRNLRPDSSYFIEGTYQRTLTSARLAWNEGGVVSFGLAGLKAGDDTTSIRYGGAAGQNLAIGTDLRLRIGEKYKMWSGAAVSATTRDIRLGVTEKNELDSLLNINLPFNPADYERLLVLNTSTMPASGKARSSIAWFLGGQGKTGPQNFSGEFRRTGPAYQSYGQPWLQNDRYEWYVQDQVGFLQKRISITLKYRDWRNNLSHQSAATYASRELSGFLTLRLNSWLPQLSLITSRNRLRYESALSSRNEIMNTLGFQGSWSGHLWPGRQSLSMGWQLMERDSGSPLQTGYDYHNLSISVVQQWPDLLTADINFSQSGLESSSKVDVPVPGQSMVSCGVQYQRPGWPVGITIRGFQYRSDLSSLFPSGSRSGVEIGMIATVWRTIDIRARLGGSSFNDRSALNKDYDESYVSMQVTQRFSLFR